MLEEVSFKLLMQSASNYLDRVTVPGVKGLLRDGEKRGLVLEPLEKYMHYLALLQESGMTVLELGDVDMRVAVRLARDHGLITADAAHLAVMERKSIRHMATGDNDFVVTGLSIWSPFA